MESGHRKLLSNPRETASWISIIFFGWSIPLFRRTYNKALDSCDVSAPLKDDRSSILGDRLERYQQFMSIERKSFISTKYLKFNLFVCRKWRDECKKKAKPSLVRAAMKAFWPECLTMGILCFFNDVVVRLILPFLLENLLSYFRWV